MRATIPMHEQLIESNLQFILSGSDIVFYSDDGGGDGETTVKDVSTFEQAGILSDNRGVVLKMTDGTEFQISIVQSK